MCLWEAHGPSSCLAYLRITSDGQLLEIYAVIADIGCVNSKKMNQSALTKLLKGMYPLNWFRLSLIDKYTLHHLSIYSLLDGVSAGVMGLASYVLLKTIGGTSGHVTVLQTMAATSFIFGIFYSEWMLGRDKRKFILYLGALARGALLLTVFVNSPLTFLLVFAVFYIFHPGLNPAINAVVQANITHRLLGRLYSVTVLVSSLSAMVGTYLGGVILNLNGFNFKWLFPLAGLLGFLGLAFLARMRVRVSDVRSEKTLYLRKQHPLMVIRNSILVPVSNTIKVFKFHSDFATFERNFFLYGLAFMMLMVVVPVFLVEKLGISYTQAGLTGLIYQLSSVLFFPIVGIWYDRLNPAEFSKRSFLILALYPLTLLLALPLKNLVGIDPISVVYLASVFFGAGMSGVIVVWYLNTIYFARGIDSAQFMGAHVTLVGVRGAIGPLTGYMIMRLAGATTAFLVAVILLLSAAGLMHLLSIRLGPRG